MSKQIVATKRMRDKMAELVAVGKSWDDISKVLGISRSKFSNFVRYDEEFRRIYKAAKIECADHYVDVVIQEALAPLHSDPKLANAGVQRQRLIVDTFMRVAGKLKPREWGDKLNLEHTGNITVSPLAQLRQLGAQVEAPIEIEAEVMDEDCF